MTECPDGYSKLVAGLRCRCLNEWTNGRGDFYCCHRHEASVEQPKPHKASYVGAPAIFKLEQACQHIADAFCGKYISGGIYMVGSCLERADWRDIDLRLILEDGEFAKLFPDAVTHTASWEFDARWLLMTVTISDWLKAQTGLPVDFQFQPRTWANQQHKGKMRNALGLRLAKDRDDAG